MLDEELQQMIAIGERNLEVIELLRRHCSHAVVSKPAFGGRGMLEAQTGLPIDMRTIRCEHASDAAPSGMQLEGIALSFWEANCQGCPHRDVRDIPNLATLGAERLAQRAAQEERLRRDLSKREAERNARAEARRARVAGESPATRAFVALLDGIDAEEPDARAAKLVDEARAAPERCSSLAGRVLLDCADRVDGDHLLEALDHLERAGRVPPEALLSVALLALSRRPTRVAAEIIVRLRVGLEFPRFDGHLTTEPFGWSERMSVDAEDPAVFQGVPFRGRGADAHQRPVGAAAGQRARRLAGLVA